MFSVIIWCFANKFQKCSVSFQLSSCSVRKSKMRKITKIKFLKFLSKISTIHGLNYIGDGKASKFSKIFWISAIILSFLGCFFFFLQVYDKVFIAPDISIKISYKPLDEFPFPAITICPHNKVNNLC